MTPATLFRAAVQFLSVYFLMLGPLSTIVVYVLWRATPWRQHVATWIMEKHCMCIFFYLCVGIASSSRKLLIVQLWRKKKSNERACQFNICNTPLSLFTSSLPLLHGLWLWTFCIRSVYYSVSHAHTEMRIDLIDSMPVMWQVLLTSRSGTYSWLVMWEIAMFC